MYFQGQLLAAALRGCGGGGGGGGEGRTISWPGSCAPLSHCGTGPPPTPDNRSPGADMGVEAFRAIDRYQTCTKMEISTCFATGHSISILHRCREFWMEICLIIIISVQTTFQKSFVLLMKVSVEDKGDIKII